MMPRRRHERNWEDQESMVAAGAVCPMPNCGALVIAYHSAESINSITRRRAPVWEFTCPACGFEFMESADELIFQSVPRHWLLAEVCHA
jgi:hypothetical protein